VGNRSADYSILISKYVENLTNDRLVQRILRKYGVCAIGNQDYEYFPSLLNVAYQYGKQRLKAEKTEEAEVDVETIKTVIENVE